MTGQRHRKRWSKFSKCVGDIALDGELPYSDVASYCNGCPVLLECRNYALLHEEYGNWGGYNRRRLTKARKSMSDNEVRALVRSAVKNNWVEEHNLYPTMTQFYQDLLSVEQTASSPFSSNTKPRADRRTLGDLLSGLSESLPEFAFQPLEEYWQVAQ